jgi:hypothetical protein
MNEGYYHQQDGYYLSQYQPMFWQSIFTGLIGIAILVAMGAWALSLVRKAIKGEEVEFPL